MSLPRLLPKSGDLSDPNRWRGICPQQVLVKLIAAIVAERLRVLLEKRGLESQNGFMRGRGAPDGFFCLRAAPARLKEYGKGAWVPLLDLVKAFDRAHRELLWAVLGMYGVPDKIVGILIVLHRGCTVGLSIETVKAAINSDAGVKQTR